MMVVRKVEMLIVRMIVRMVVRIMIVVKFHNQDGDVMVLINSKVFLIQELCLQLKTC